MQLAWIDSSSQLSMPSASWIRTEAVANLADFGVDADAEIASLMTIGVLEAGPGGTENGWLLQVRVEDVDCGELTRAELSRQLGRGRVANVGHGTEPVDRLSCRLPLASWNQATHSWYISTMQIVATDVSSSE